MEKSMFVNAAEVARDFSVSKSTAYVIIKRLNDELDKKGYITVHGRVSRKYYIERIYGYDEYADEKSDTYNDD